MVYTHSIITSLHYSPTPNLQMNKQKKHFKLCSYNTLSNITMLQIGSGNKLIRLKYVFFLNHHKLLQSNCKIYQKIRGKGCTQLTIIIAVSAMISSIQQDALSTQIKCTTCRYTQPRRKCTVYAKKCYKCGVTGHFTSLCRKPYKPEWQDTTGWSHTHLEMHRTHHWDSGYSECHICTQKPTGSKRRSSTS